MPFFELSADSPCIFPPSEMAMPDGFLAVGGDLSIKRLVNAYTMGIFPWYNPGDPIQWWCPKERFVIFPNKIHISKTMRKFMKTSPYNVKINTDFPLIINACRMLRENETWLSDEMEAAYNAMFNEGHVLCVGVYENDTLVGGLYGVSLGKCFSGESMFSKATNASKIALIHLSKYLYENDYEFIDCQFHTPHLESMGGTYISWFEYKRLLKLGLKDFPLEAYWD